MKASNTLTLLGLMLLGCSSEHTIASEVAAEQSVTAQPRTVCVDMCNYAVDCGQINEDELSTCQTTCENDCKRLEAALPETAINTTTQPDVNSQTIIKDVSACYLASECSLDKGDECYPEYIATEASVYEQHSPYATKTDAFGSSYSIATIGACGTALDGETCEFDTDQINDAGLHWTSTCNRPNSATQEWTCHCFENGVETKKTTQVLEDESARISNLCWTDEELTCFNAGLPNC